MNYENKKNIRKRIRIASIVTAIFVVLVSVAFAALSQSLNISFGTVTQTAMTWGVGFKGTSATPVQSGTSNTGLSCGMASITSSTVTIAESTLSKPGDKCTYTLTVQNTGDVPAKLNSIATTQPSGVSCSSNGGTMVCGNITYSLTKIDGSELEIDTIINNASTLDLKLVVSYTGTELSSNVITHNGVKYTLTYQQSDTGTDDEAPTEPKIVKCRRATTLHTEVCPNSSSGCYRFGNHDTGSNITYGSKGTSGTLNSGDAFDCDVNGDGTFNSTNERFYYVSGLDGDDTSNYAVLIYYTNVSAGIPRDTSEFAYYANNNNSSSLGPVTAYQQLPSTSQWSNVSLSSQIRQIYDETGSDKNGTLAQFTYTDKVARLLSYKEISAGCDLSPFGSSITISNCEYLFEHTFYSTNTSSVNTDSWWIENPVSNNGLYAWGVDGYSSLSGGYSSNKRGVRPAIEVLKTNIDY